MEILVKTCLMPLALKTQNDSFAFVHELKQEMHADLKYVESLEDELDELESDKAEFSNMYDMLLQECVSKDVMCSYLQSSSDLDEITELQCLYLHKVMECDCLAQKLSEQTEFVSKEIYTELLQSFAKLEKHSISLEIALQECQEQLKNDTVCKEKASNVFRKEREQYLEIQDLKAQLQDKNIAIRVAHKTNVSRPRPRSNQMKDKVVPNTSHVKTSNVNDVCATCGKCVFNSNHDACVSKYLKDVNARSKKPKVVPISASKPKRKTNKSVATPHKKTVASDTTIQKPKSYFKELYENTNKAWKWWIEKKCPSEYKWTQTTPSRPSLKWKPTGRIFSNVRSRWIPTGKLLNSCTGKVDSEPAHGSIVDIPHIHACKQ
ncbi:hypothetical protein Tco_1448260, partial [Tanacetum coccineum]